MNILVSGTAFLNALEMKLMYIKNNRGPSTDPKMTPHSTICDDDVLPFKLINSLHDYLSKI